MKIVANFDVVKRAAMISEEIGLKCEGIALHISELMFQCSVRCNLPECDFIESCFASIVIKNMPRASDD